MEWGLTAGTAAVAGPQLSRMWRRETLGGGRSQCSLEMEGCHCPNMAFKENEFCEGWHGSRAEPSLPSHPEPERPREERGRQLLI